MRVDQVAFRHGVYDVSQPRSGLSFFTGSWCRKTGCTGGAGASIVRGSLAHDDDVAAARLLGGGAVAGFPVDGDLAGHPGVVAAALRGKERPRLTSALSHAGIQTYYRIT